MAWKVPAERLPQPIGDGVSRIQLTHGKFAYIDSSDASIVSSCCWFAHMRTKKPRWYATGAVNGKQIRLHRHILGLSPQDARQVDHINGDVSDNRRCNLRIVDNVQNNQNRRTATGRLGLKGVYQTKLGKYRCKMTVNGKCLYIGTYSTPIEAAIAYDAAAEQHFGEYAATNRSLGLLDLQEANQ